MIPITVVVWLACSTLAAKGATPDDLALFQASREGDSSAVRKLLGSAADLESRNAIDDTPLMNAALNADTRVFKLLLEAGANVNATNRAGVTALMRAATFEDKTRLLVAKGAEVNARSRTGNSAILLAARKPGNSRTVNPTSATGRFWWRKSLIHR